MKVPVLCYKCVVFLLFGSPKVFILQNQLGTQESNLQYNFMLQHLITFLIHIAEKLKIIWAFFQVNTLASLPSRSPKANCIFNKDVQYSFLWDRRFTFTTCQSIPVYKNGSLNKYDRGKFRKSSRSRRSRFNLFA